MGEINFSYALNSCKEGNINCMRFTGFIRVTSCVFHIIFRRHPNQKSCISGFVSLLGLFIQKAFNNMKLNGWAVAISTYNDWESIFVRVTLQPNRFLYNKTNQLHQFHKFILAWNSNMFRTVRLSIIRSLFTVHSAMVYVVQVCRRFSSRARMELQFHSGPARRLYDI
jgi:hypothetical protein